MILKNRSYLLLVINDVYEEMHKKLPKTNLSSYFFAFMYTIYKRNYHQDSDRNRQGNARE